jgi:glycerophosphoryl diester phosphodiesterase
VSIPDLGWIARRPIAHRGLHDAAAGCIENTRPAFEAAIAGRYAIELDVQMSADGEAMVFHDDTLERLTSGSGHVQAQRAAALGAIPFLHGAARMETLPAILALVAGRVPLVIEIKSAFRGDLRLTERVSAIMAEYSGPFVVKSFDPRIVIALRRLSPDLPRGIVSMRDYHDDAETAHLPPDEMRSMTEMLHFAQSEPHVVSWYVEDLPCAQTYFSRTMLGRPLMCWTVRTATQVALVRAHADQMVFEGFSPA